MVEPPLVAHVIHHLVIGGLENGLVNLINRIPETRFRHAVVCMQDYSDFKNRIQRDDVEVIAINKRAGHDPAAQWRLFKLFREMKPSITHTRNLSALDALLPAMLVGVKCRIHGEHGRDVGDLDGNNRKLQLLRRLHRPLISRYIPLSRDLESYLHNRIGVPRSRMTQIYNGVDTDKFIAADGGRLPLPTDNPLFHEKIVIIGTVGRFQPVKDQMTLAKAFVNLLQRAPDLRSVARLALIGDGPCRMKVLEYLHNTAGVDDLVWCPGARNDIHSLLQSLDIFALPSLGEGISNTLLEAMASGLPVVATDVGGNPELVDDGNTGFLVPAAAPVGLADQLEAYLRDPDLRRRHGSAGRQRVVEQFSLNVMVERYVEVYEEVLAKHEPSP